MNNSCVRGTMLFSSKCWALRQEDKNRLECSKRTMILWMCNIKKEHVSTSKNITLSSAPEYIQKKNSARYRWNVSVKTVTKVPHNKAGLMIWNQEEEICNIIEFSCPLDISINIKVNENQRIMIHMFVIYRLCILNISSKLFLWLLLPWDIRQNVGSVT